MGVVDVPEDVGDGAELRQELLVDVLPAAGDDLDRHGQPLLLVEVDDDVRDRAATPGVEQVLRKGAFPLRQRPLPGHVVQGHGVGDGAVAVEEVRLEVAGGKGQRHRSSL